MNDAKQAAKDAIDKMEDLSDADKTAAKAYVDKA
ncbi:GA module-containing protein, partial [Lactobacillus jensenii]